MYLPENEMNIAPIIVTVAYKEPKPAFVIFIDSNQNGTNSEIKKVCPKEEKKLNKKPKTSKRLLPLKIPNQSLIITLSKDLH